MNNGVNSFNIGGFFGYTVNNALLESVNGISLDDFYSNEYNTRCSDIDRMFRERLFLPAIRDIEYLQETHQDLIKPNTYRCLTNKKDFYDFPQIMREAVLMEPHLRKLLKQGRIGGWDIQEEMLPNEDVYTRLYENGVIEDCASYAGEDAPYKILVRSTDPILDDDPIKQNQILESIMYTRKKAKELCMNNIDFSDPDSTLS